MRPCVRGPDLVVQYSSQQLFQGLSGKKGLSDPNKKKEKNIIPISSQSFPGSPRSWLRKYSYANFIGGVLSFRPGDFRRVNGYPNNYWGWGLEDDQLGLRG